MSGKHVELAWSPDSYTWHRIAAGTPFIGPTSTHKETFGDTPYDWGNIFAAQPVFRDNEIRIYYGASDWYFFDWRRGSLALATLQPDNWAGYEPIDAERPAIVETRLVTWIGGGLRITARVEESGAVEVSLLDRARRRIASSKPLRRTVCDGEIPWLSELLSKRTQGRAGPITLHRAKREGLLLQLRELTDARRRAGSASTTALSSLQLAAHCFGENRSDRSRFVGPSPRSCESFSQLRAIGCLWLGTLKFFQQ